MNKIYTLAFSCSLFVSTGFAQVPLAWEARYNGSGNQLDESHDLVVDSLGNVYVTGTSMGSSGTFDIVTIKYNSFGIQQWVATFNGAGNDNDNGAAIGLDDSLNVYVVGSQRTTLNYNDIVVMKYNSNGILQWLKSYDGTMNGIDEGRDIVVDGQGNSYICGTITQTANLYGDYVTMKHDRNGVQQWVKYYNGTGGGTDDPIGISLDGSGNVYVAGSANGDPSILNFDYVAIKYDNNGNQQWMATYDSPISPDNDFCNTLYVDKFSNVYLAGRSQVVANNWFDYVTVKFNSAGVQQWYSSYNNGPTGNNRWDEAWAVIADTLGNVYVTGQSQATGSSSAPADFATIKYNSAGVQQWATRFNGPPSLKDVARAIMLDDTLNVYVAGTCEKIAANYDYLMIKYDNAGTQEWLTYFNGTANGLDEPDNTIFMDDQGSIYLTGYSDGNPSTSAANNDFCTLKYSPQFIGIDESNYANNFLCFPNPFSQSTAITFSSKERGGTISVKIYDTTGRIVTENFSEKVVEKTPGIFELQINSHSAQSGFYFVKTFNSANELIFACKMVKN